MTLLDVITNAAANREALDFESDFPIILNADECLKKLKPKFEKSNQGSLVNPLNGWKLPEANTKNIEFGQKFLTKLNRRLKDTNNFDKDEFLGIFLAFLEMSAENVGIAISFNQSLDTYPCFLMEKVGHLMSKELNGLVLMSCIRFELWDLVEALLVKKTFVYHSKLITSLLEKNKPNLVCLVVNHASDLRSSELHFVLKYFLSPTKKAVASLVKVREEWEKEASLAADMASDTSAYSLEKIQLVKDAAILLMMAYDGFSASELCLHFFLAQGIDGTVLSSAVRKLSGGQMMKLVRYLGKWLKKYERFPQAQPCPEAASIMLELCDSVPKLEEIVKWLGLIVDENFPSLVLDPEFHEELKSLNGAVGSLASESKLCPLMSLVIGKLIVSKPN